MSKTSSRIISRKLVFLYFYARLFNEDILQQPIEVDEIQPKVELVHEELDELTDWLGVSNDELTIQEEVITPTIKIMNDESLTEDIDFIAHHQLALHSTHETSSYDHDFVLQIAGGYHIYRPIIESLINPYTEKFPYAAMSLTRRAILLLGYIEYHIIKTPATIVINECVELAKSYEDVAAAKLINGIMHQLLGITTDPESAISSEQTTSSEQTMGS